MHRFAGAILLPLMLSSCGSESATEHSGSAALVTEVQAAEVQRFSPRTNFALHCQGCHLPDGSGFEGRVPDMRGELSAMIRLPEGRRYLVQVPGTANSSLDNRETADLLNWLVPAMGPKPVAAFKPYTEAEVAALRAMKVEDVAAMRARVLAQLPEH